MRAIIIGANGQDGYYLSHLLKGKNCDVVGVSKSGNFLKTDITDLNHANELIKTNQPDYIFHLAANSTTDHYALFENHAVIATGTLNILEAVNKYSSHTRVFICGSGLQFKISKEAIKETDEFEARDAYSISRIQSVYAARYFRTLGIKTYVGYLFNHESPMRSERHISKKISETAKRIAHGSSEILEIGDVSVVKEYGFAGDIVKGIWTLVNQHEIFEANISTGEGHSIEEWLHLCFSLVKKDWKDHVVIQQNFTAGYKKLVSNPELIFSLGWKPEVSFENLGKLMVS
jgi:GDPmannose 4,6-dehydratase